MTETFCSTWIQIDNCFCVIIMHRNRAMQKWCTNQAFFFHFLYFCFCVIEKEIEIIMKIEIVLCHKLLIVIFRWIIYCIVSKLYMRCQSGFHHNWIEERERKKKLWHEMLLSRRHAHSAPFVFHAPFHIQYDWLSVWCAIWLWHFFF